MKIENKVYDNHMTFGDLSYGDVFIYNDEVYIKTDGDYGDSNATSLESGYKMILDQDYEVRLVTATLTIM